MKNVILLGVRVKTYNSDPSCIFSGCQEPSSQEIYALINTFHSLLGHCWLDDRKVSDKKII